MAQQFRKIHMNKLWRQSDKVFFFHAKREEENLNMHTPKSDILNPHYNIIYAYVYTGTLHIHEERNIRKSCKHPVDKKKAMRNEQSSNKSIRYNTKPKFLSFFFLGSWMCIPMCIRDVGSDMEVLCNFSFSIGESTSFPQRIPISQFGKNITSSTTTNYDMPTDLLTLPLI